MPTNSTQDANRYTDGKLCRDASGYMVMQWTAFQGWVNTWTIIKGDGSEAPEIFATVEDAQAALDEHFAQMQAEREAGERDPDSGDFDGDLRIMEADAASPYPFQIPHATTISPSLPLTCSIRCSGAGICVSGGYTVEL